MFEPLDRTGFDLETQSTLASAEALEQLAALEAAASGTPPEAMLPASTADLDFRLAIKREISIAVSGPRR